MGESANVSRAVRWLAEAGGSAAPGELGAALGVGHTTQAKVTQTLRAARLVSGGKDRISLTAAGWARAGALDSPGAGIVLDAAGKVLPYAHRAFLELLCSAVVARHHLADARPRGHLGFMAIGETGTGKTATAELAAHLFGLDRTAVVRLAYAETPGSLLGRRERDGDGWRMLPAEAAGLPLLLVDEFDKADEPARRAAWAFFQGETTARHEGQAWPVRPVPVLAANPPRSGNRYALLRPEYRRRSVVLDTGYTRGRGQEIAAALRGYYERAAPGGLCLDQLRPPAERLDARGVAVLESLHHALTEVGAEEFPGVEALELAALGRMALTGRTDHAEAAYATCVAYLQASETVPGQVAEDWQPDLAMVRRWFGQDAAGPLAEAIERGRAARAKLAHQARAQVTEREAASDSLAADRAELAERLALAAAALQPRKLAILDDGRKASAAGVRAVLAKLRAETQASRTAGRLAELAARTAGPLANAARIAADADTERAHRDQARQAAARERTTLARQAAEDRRRNAELRKAVAGRQRAMLAEITGQARNLERLYARTTTRSGESPFEILRALEVNGRPLLTYQAPEPLAKRGGWRRVVDAMAAPRWGRWVITGSGETLPGRPHQCPGLAQWGDNTRAVLAPALAALHQAEDELRAALGRPRRAGRAQPTLYVSAPRSLPGRRR